MMRHLFFAIFAVFFAIPAFAVSDDIEYTDALRVPPECGCEEGNMYLYWVDAEGRSQKRFLMGLQTDRACEERLLTAPPAECR